MLRAAASTSNPDLLSSGRHAQGKIVLQAVPLVSQQNYTACGEAAFAMAWNYAHPAWSVDLDTLERTGMELGAYFPSARPGPGGYVGTSPAGMEALGAFFAARYEAPPPATGNIDLDNGDAYAQQQARGLLYSQLASGYPLIVEVTDIVGAPSRAYNDSHYVVITGMDFSAGRVIYNDPYMFISMGGKYSGLGRVAEWSAIWTSWSGNRDVNPGRGGHPGRGWYMVVH